MTKEEIINSIKKQASELIERYKLEGDRFIIGFDKDFEVDFTLSEQPLEGWISWTNRGDFGDDFVDILAYSVNNL